MPSDYSLREWHVQEGLPHDEVASVRQDRSGYLWAATAGGLARFDSVHFDDYSAQLRAVPASPAIRAMTETESMGLVLAPESGGLVLVKDGVFRATPLAGSQLVNALHAESDGTVWASCDDRTVLRIRSEHIETFGPAEIPNGRPLAFFATDGLNRTWIASGMYIGRYESGRLVAWPHSFDRTELRVASSRRHGPWIVTKDRVHHVDGEQLDAGVSVPPLVGAHYVRALHEDRHGNLWLGTRSQGLFLVADGRCQAMPASSEDILSICEDAEGDIWVATNGGGLDRLRRRDFRLFDKAAGLQDNFSYTVCEDAQGTIWFGNRDGGLARARNGVVDVVPLPVGWSKISAMSVFPDTQGGLWMTGGTHVHHLGSEPGAPLTRVDAVPSLSMMRGSFVARNGDLWLTIDPDKVGRLAGEQFELFGNDEGLVGRQIRCITEDAAGRIWTGTTDGKVFRLEGRRFVPVPVAWEGEPVPIQAIYFDATGMVWLGTAGRGLVALTEGGPRRVDRSAGMPDDSISQIIADDHGYLWCGSTRGIFCVPQKELADFAAGNVPRIHATVIGRDDGVKGISCLGIFQPAVWKSRDGRLWFATRKGVLTFDPAAVIPDETPPPVLIAEVKFDDHRQPVGGALEVPATVRKLEFRFSVLRFAAPDRVQIKYRVEGFDSDWVAAGAERTAVYPSLPPGRYELQVIASLGNGNWNDQPAKVAFTVLPQWWRTLWFQLAALGVLVSGVAIVVRVWSHRRLRTKLEHLEREGAIERERTRIARNIHDDLGASLTRISLLTQCDQPADGNAGAARINHIYQAAGEIIRSMDEIVWAVDPKHDNLESLAGYLGNFAQSFLQIAGIRCRLIMPERLPPLNLTSQLRHHLFLCCKEALNNSVKHARADVVTLTIQLSGPKLVIQVADNGTGLKSAAPDVNRGSAGRGLANMRQRMAELGGRCTIGAAEREGTIVTFEVELPAHATEATLV